jgi:hypothetical protein
MAADGMTPWLAPGCRRPWVVGRHGGPADYDGVFALRRPGPYLGKWITEDSCGGLTMTSRTLERLHWRTSCRRNSPSASAAATIAAANSFLCVFAAASLARSTSWSRRRSAGTGQVRPACLVTAVLALRSAPRCMPLSSSFKRSAIGVSSTY